MKYTRRSYRRKRSVRKRRSFKKRRPGNKMMSTSAAWVRQTWTESFPLVNRQAPTNYTAFSIDCLGVSTPAPEMQLNMAETQADA